MLAGDSKSQQTKEKSTELSNGQHIIITIIINIAF